MTNTVKLDVGGMSCNGCVRSVTSAVSRLDGVKNVDVSLAAKSATVEYDPSVANPTIIIAAIEDAGFEAKAAA